MRDIQFPGRSVLHAVNGAAATSNPLSTLAAIDVLKAGGNAVDAAVTACAVQCVVEPMSTGIGGDCFALVQPGGTGPVAGLNGSGHAPAGLNAEWLLAQGLDRIELESVHAVTIPGAIDAWCWLLENHGTWGIDQVVQPAIRYAAEGFAVTPRVALDWQRNETKLAADPNARRIYLKDGKAPRAGDKWHLPELAETLRAVAAKGRDGFYGGSVADDMVATLAGLGGRHATDDFAAQAAEPVTPIRTTYRDLEVLELPPNGQGVTALIMLNMLEGFDLAALDPVGVERLHLEAEVTRLAYAARDAYVADPRQAEVPTDWLVSKAFAAEQRAKIDPARVMPYGAPVDVQEYRDTIYLSVVDRDRNAVSFINSLYFQFGSGIVSNNSGVVFQNRGAGFRVEPGHPNCVAPRKRPMHTIIPAMVLRDGRCVLSFGVMGGGYQPLGHTHVLTNLVDFGMDIQQAIDGPRMAFVHGQLDLERGIPDPILAGLKALGHPVGRPEMPWGGGQAVQIDWQRGTLAAGSDPRKDGLALGY